MDPKKQYYENTANTIIKNLNKRQMNGYYCPDTESARKKVLELLPEGASVGWGGSMTLNETGILPAIIEGPYREINRDKAITPEEQKKVYSEIFSCDYFS